MNSFSSWDTSIESDLIEKLWFPHFEKEEVSSIRSFKEANDEFIKKTFENFLKEFSVRYFQKEYNITPVDEKLIHRLRATIQAISINVTDSLKKYCNENKDFREKLTTWFFEQGWTLSFSDSDFEKVSKQYVLLLINKIIFYNVLRPKHNLPKIELQSKMTNESFRKTLEVYFNECLKEDYEAVFSPSILDTFELNEEALSQASEFIKRINDYEFTKNNYEIIGRIFERLIPDQERRKFGQYFTSSNVVDLIVGFCVRKGDDKVLDGSCGAGTFLVRSYIRKKHLEITKSHDQLLDDLYGIDIAKFPAHIATINLAVRGLAEKNNYPKIICADFFDILPEKEKLLLPIEYNAKTLGLSGKKVKIPIFDAVVMNPVHTARGNGGHI